MSFLDTSKGVRILPNMSVCILLVNNINNRYTKEVKPQQHAIHLKFIGKWETEVLMGTEYLNIRFPDVNKRIVEANTLVLLSRLPEYNFT